ncbi:MAG TPA: Mpo1-like protein [Rhodanobacteraceae bacterium]|nr:Mpo1-like protein [Rhodanobacteraceae bacterium]
MRTIHDWFGSYSADHQNETNRAIHWLCVPVILWCVIALLWLIPVPEAIGRAGFWAFIAMFAAFLFYYFKLSRPLGLAMAMVFIVFSLIAEGAYRALGPQHLLWLAIALFVIAWIGQFVGHIIEGKRPSFFTDLAYLLIGPAWLTGKLMRRAGISY